MRADLYRNVGFKNLVVHVAVGRIGPNQGADRGCQQQDAARGLDPQEPAQWATQRFNKSKFSASPFGRQLFRRHLLGRIVGHDNARRYPPMMARRRLVPWNTKRT